MRELLTLAVIGLGTYAMRAAFLVMARNAAARLRWPACCPTWDPRCWPRSRCPRSWPRTAPSRSPSTAPALLAAAVAWLAWRRLRRNLPIALFGGLAAWWMASWAVTRRRAQAFLSRSP